ncbi:hypothetical protein COB52_02915 [Candidatus Kaiserbacteria bacterium]|nr:MAG: hypothetical protein COB52_02915 [Candidatus Kaiserbacteria bacterium]
MKTNKSFSKRIRVTKNGKLVVRKPGQNHNNAKMSGNQKMAQKRSVLLKMTNKQKSRFLPNK